MNCVAVKASNPTTTNRGLKEFMEACKRRLSRDTTRDVTGQEITALKQENTDLS